MKKLIALLFAGGIVVGGAFSASADPIETDAGSATVNEGGYVLLLDGAPGNEDPLDGYAGIDDDGNAQCSDEGDGYTYDEDGNRTGTADGGCHPENQLPQ